MINENTPFETGLGINNFRREYQGQVNTLTRIPPINPVLEDLTKPETFNKRFKQVSEAQRHVFNAMGDIAIRDKRYLETFLTGYANPFVTQSFKYEYPDMRKNVNIYDLNGNPIKFPEDRIAYTIDNTGTVNFTSVHDWVFIDGVLAPKDAYTIVNTAYGLRCFIKATFIKSNTEVTVVLNRLFNTTGVNSTTINLTKDATTFSALFPVEKFGTFYDVRYLKALVKTATNQHRTIPNRNINFELDLTGNTVRMDIVDYPLVNGETIVVLNCIVPSLTERTITTSSSSSWDTRFLLVTDKDRAYKSALDFDVFLDGYKLIPHKHFSVIEDGDTITANTSYLVLNCNRKSTQTNHKEFKVQIFKNESVAYNDGADIAYTEKLDCSGLFVRPVETSKLPFMTRIGHCTIGGRYTPNKDVQTLQRSVIALNRSRNEYKDFAFQTRVVRTTDITAIMDHSQRNLSEFDLALQAVGEQHVLDNYRALHPCTTEVNPLDITIEERFAQWLTWDIKQTQGDMANLDDVMQKRTNKNVTLVLDANSPDSLQQRDELALFFNSGLVIDANEYMPAQFYGKNAIIDANEAI